MTSTAPSPEQTPDPARRGLGWLLLLFFISGASGLIYEIVWLRKLTLIFGETALAVSTVLACFMAGLGFGSLWFGRWIERRPGRALAAYVWLELGIGAYGLLSLPLLDAFAPVYVWAYRHLHAGFYALSLLRLACAFVVLLPATFLMGGTLPVLCRYFARRREIVGSLVARLYAANTLGATAGCFAASFFIVGWIGVRATTRTAAGLNLAAALGAWLVARGLRASAEQPKAGPDEAPADGALEYPRWSRRWMLVVIALCGFCGLAYESFWTRLLSHVVGLDVQAFGLMLSSLLLGIGLGSALAPRLPLARANPLPAFIVVELLLAAAAVASVAVFARIGRIHWIIAGVVGLGDFWSGVALRFGMCAAMVFIPSVLMGAAFPLAVRLYAAGGGVGRQVGAAYAANTFGAIAGSLAAGFALMPLLGANWSLIAKGLLSAETGLSLLGSCPSLTRARLGRGVLALAALVVACAVVYAAPAARKPPVYSTKSEKEFRVLWYGEDLAGSVSVLQNRFNPELREVNINGLSVAYTSYDDICVQKLLAHLPVLLHADPRDMLVIGFGSGSTCGSSLLHPVHTTCVELQPQELITARFFTDLNHDVLKQKDRFSVHIGDGRNYLFMTRKRFDVISRDTLTPKESQDLFSVEFYELCRSRLRAGGVFCGFLPTDIVPTAAYFKMLVRSFMAVFPHGSVWYVGPHCSLLLGTTEPLRIDYQRLGRRMKRPGVQAELKRIRMDDPAVFLNRLIAAGPAMKAFAGPGSVATDDRPLGFALTERMLTFSEGDKLAAELARIKEPPTKYLTNPGPARERILARLDRADRAARLAMIGRQAAWRGDYTKAWILLRRAMDIFPDDRSIPYDAGRAALELSKKVRDRSPSDAVRLARKALEVAPDLAEAYVVIGQAQERLGRPDDAARAYHRALQLNSGLVIPRLRLKFVPLPVSPSR